MQLGISSMDFQEILHNDWVVPVKKDSNKKYS